MNQLLILLFLVISSCVTSDKKLSSFSTLHNLSETTFRSSQMLSSVDPESEHYQNKNEHHIFFSRITQDLSQSGVQRFFQSRKNYLKSLYQSDEDPYFLKTSRSDVCIQNLKLDGESTENTSFESLTFQLPTTNQFVLGQCNPILETFEAEIIFLYCRKSKTVFELKYFKPKNTPTQIQFSLSQICEVH